MAIAEQINAEIKEAMRNRNQVRLDTLRMLKSKILNVDARGNLSDVDILKLFKTYFGSLQEAFEQAQVAKRPEMAEKLKAELDIVQEFLPRSLSAEETKEIVIQAIAATGAKSKRDAGLVMKNIMQQGQAIEGKLAKDLVAELLPE